ncbi:hypothetical protein F5144DRAFT_598324 [Chaetomium tenue]|uniref:Uncharacterized protein n=1 Tax=Chaetomium tenue TaxID=1854479 RepID=A0ACB7PQ47_9PEZI|nr:hypothetical protein F5144DRAFT_598324 [Chaetomium globosum]
MAQVTKKQSLRDRLRRGQNGENNPFVVPKAHNSTIEIALRSLRHELNASLKVFQALVQCFEADIEPIQSWAEDFTLDTVWKNKVKKFFREQQDKRGCERMTARISYSRAAVKDAIKNAKALKEASGGKHNLERQILTAKKAVAFCDGIVGLAERAASERLACKQLVVELEEARSLLDRKKHPWIYGEEQVEQHAGDMKNLNGPVAQARSEEWHEGNWRSREELGGWFEPAGVFPFPGYKR